MGALSEILHWGPGVSSYAPAHHCKEQCLPGLINCYTYLVFLFWCIWLHSMSVVYNFQTALCPFTAQGSFTFLMPSFVDYYCNSPVSAYFAFCFHNVQHLWLYDHVPGRIPLALTLVTGFRCSSVPPHINAWEFEVLWMVLHNTLLWQWSHLYALCECTTNTSRTFF